MAVPVQNLPVLQKRTCMPMTTRTMHSGVPVARRLSPSDSQGAGPPMVSLSRRITTLQGTPGPIGWSPGGMHRWQGHAFRSVLLPAFPVPQDVALRPHQQTYGPPGSSHRVTGRIPGAGWAAFAHPSYRRRVRPKGLPPAGPGCVSRQPSTAHLGSAGELRCGGAAGAWTALNGDRRSLEPQTGARSGGAAARSDRSPAEGHR